jgi:threonine/homoserine/homoserine lactone efflux protein
VAAAPLSLFVAASLALAVTPGPGVAYIVARTLAEGRRAGLWSVAGVALGNLANAALAGVGLAALLALWPAALPLLRLAGGLYLIGLGVMAWRARPAPGAAAARAPLRDGFWVALLNPKTALFFAAFLPPFIDPAGSAALQSLALGALFALIAALTDALWVLAAAGVAPRLSRRAGAGRALAAAVYVALGLFTLWPR